MTEIDGELIHWLLLLGHVYVDSFIYEAQAFALLMDSKYTWHDFTYISCEMAIATFMYSRKEYMTR